MEIAKFTLLTLCLALLASCTTHHPPAGKPTAAYSDAGLRETLTTHVNDQGKVNYTALAKDSGNLGRYYQHIATTDPNLLDSQDAKLAYWINSYNATVLWNVLAHYPIRSVLDVPPKKIGFFVNQRFIYGGKTTNLYYLENSVIRKRFKDPRIHFALNCASISCPLLPQTPFTPENLHAELDRETKAFINSNRYVQISQDGKTLAISSIFKWYEKDFTNWLKINHPDKPASLISYISHYASPDLQRKLANISEKVQFLPYDWGLNNQS